MRTSIFVALVVIIIAGAAFTLYKNFPKPEIDNKPETIAKTTKSTEKRKSVNEVNDRGLSKVDEFEESETPEWLSDQNQKPVQTTDIWKAFTPDDSLIDEETGEKIDVDNIDIRNPESYDILRKSLVKRYGDTTEVQNYLDTWVKAVANPSNMKYKTEFAKAAYEMFSHPVTRRSMEILSAIQNNDTETLHKYAEPSTENTMFLDVRPFFRNNPDHAEAFRKLREFNPKRSAEFEKFILEQARNDPHIDFEKSVGILRRRIKAKLIKMKHLTPNR